MALFEFTSAKIIKDRCVGVCKYFRVLASTLGVALRNQPNMPGDIMIKWEVPKILLSSMQPLSEGNCVYGVTGYIQIIINGL